jgi:FkbM family methyltransferase
VTFAIAVRDNLALLTRSWIPKGSWRLAPYLNRLFEAQPVRVHIREIGWCRLDLRNEDLSQIFWSGLEKAERAVIRLTRQLLPPDGVFVDAGANIGCHTLAAGRHLTERGRVIAFEPHPGNFALLKVNVAENGMTNVALEPFGLSDAPAKLDVRADSLAGNWSVASTGQHRFQVELVRLDDYFDRKPIPRLDVLKMDIEGSEVKALRGAVRTMQRFRPALIFEANPMWLKRMGTSLAELFNTVEAMDYTVHALPVDIGSLGPPLSAQQRAEISDGAWPNFLAVPRGHASLGKEPL